MPWKCPNGCKEFEVSWAEFREDCIIHFFDPEDKDLMNELSHKVYVGSDSNFDKPECSECEALVDWEN